MAVRGTVQALSEYKRNSGEIANEVEIDPDEFMLVLTLIEAKAVNINPKLAKINVIITITDSFLSIIL